MNSKSSDTSDPDLGILTVRKQLCIPRGPIQLVLQVTPSLCTLRTWKVDTSIKRRAEHFGR